MEDINANQNIRDHFMINEYNAMQKFRELIIGQVDQRVNTYLRLISATIAIIPAFSFLLIKNNKNIDYMLLCIACILISMLLFLFGLLTFYRVIEGHISIIVYTRSINRLRRYFYLCDRSIGNFLSMPINDDLPEFGTYGFSSVKTIKMGATSLVISLNVLNCLFYFGLMIWFVSMWFHISMGVYVIFSIIAILLSLGYMKKLRKIYNERMIQANNNCEVRFPS